MIKMHGYWMDICSEDDRFFGIILGRKNNYLGRTKIFRSSMAVVLASLLITKHLKKEREIGDEKTKRLFPL